MHSTNFTINFNLKHILMNTNNIIMLNILLTLYYIFDGFYGTKNMFFCINLRILEKLK